MLAMVLIITMCDDVHAANYDNGNNYAYDYAEHDDQSAENYAMRISAENYAWSYFL